MNWPVTRSAYSVYIGILTSWGYSHLGFHRFITGLCPGLVSKEVPAGENPVMAGTFLNQFVRVGLSGDGLQNTEGPFHLEAMVESSDNVRLGAT